MFHALTAHLSEQDTWRWLRYKGVFVFLCVRCDGCTKVGGGGGEGEKDLQPSSSPASTPSSGQPHPSPSGKMFHHHESAVSSVCPDATQAPGGGGLFQIPSSPLGLNPLQVPAPSRRERVERVGVQLGEERVFLRHTRSELLSLFALRLGNSFLFNRISCSAKKDMTVKMTSVTRTQCVQNFSLSR